MKLKNKAEVKKNNFALLSELWIGVSAALLVFLIFLIPTLNLFELVTLDYRFRSRLTPPANPAIILIGVDDKSIEKIGRWPWPRSYHGQLISALKEAGAKVIGFDVLFTEPSEDPAEDQALTRAIAESENVFLPFYFKTLETNSLRLPSGSQPVFPIPEIQKAAAGICPINAPPDRDGITRSIPLIIRADNKLYPTLGLALLLSYLDIPPENLKLNRGHLEIINSQGRKLLIPIDRQGRMAVNFAAAQEKNQKEKRLACFTFYPYETILLSYFQEKSGEKPALPLQQFKDKIIIVGANASGIGDLKPTPVSPLFPMFALHANIINNILGNNFLVRPNGSIRFLILLVLSLSTAAVVGRKRLVRGVFSSILLLVIYGLVTLQLFNKNIWLDLAAPFSVIFLVCLSGTLNNFLAEQREKKFIRSTFQRYVAPEIVQKLLSEKNAGSLGGGRNKVTVLFADIRGFTRISENLPPEEVVELLNQSLTVIAAAIFKYQGTLDKFIGDCVMAIFGAPLAQKDQELMAIKSALEMKREIIGVSERWLGKLGVTVEIGIGINTGEAVVGNIGSAERMDYTAIGDTVNLAQRLQSLATAGQIMVSENTFRSVTELVSGTVQPPVQLKGKINPVTFYEVHGLKS